LSTNGFDKSIGLGDILLWSSTNNNRRYDENIDEDECLLTYVKTEFDNFCQEMNKINKLI